MKASLVFLILAVATAVRSQEDTCPPEQEHDWSIEKLLRHENCNKYYLCTFGVPVERRCPEDLYFNLETWQCDWQHNVDCSDRIIPGETTLEPTTTTPEPTTTTPEPTTTTPEPTTTTPEPTTTTPEPTTTTPEPTTTTTTTTTTTPAPTTTTTTTTTTPAPTTTTTTTTTPAPTTTTTTTTQAPTTEEPTTVIEFAANGCPVDPHIHWLLPDAEDCTLYYYCVWGQLVLRECPPGLHFNRVKQVCDWPHDAGCTVSFNKHWDGRTALMAGN